MFHRDSSALYTKISQTKRQLKDLISGLVSFLLTGRFEIQEKSSCVLYSFDIKDYSFLTFVFKEVNEKKRKIVTSPCKLTHALWLCQDRKSVV